MEDRELIGLAESKSKSSAKGSSAQDEVAESDSVKIKKMVRGVAGVKAFFGCQSENKIKRGQK